MWVEDYQVGNETYTGCYNLVSQQLIEMPANQCGGEIISSVTSKGYKLVEGNSQDHLGSYSTYLAQFLDYLNTITPQKNTELLRLNHPFRNDLYIQRNTL